jgi:DNA repair protein RecN (Recombination protein N)
MIRHLSIKNFALIKELTLSFDQGFTVITGETGSGKSIFLNSLNLLSGERADFNVIGTDGDKSAVEAVFKTEELVFHELYAENDLEVEDELIVRREISKTGRSRAFINDTPVQLGVMRQFMTKLIYIHSQYNTIELKDPEYQLEILDILVGTTEEKARFQKKFTFFKKQKQKLESLKAEQQKTMQEKDYIDFQLKELESLQLEKTDYKSIEEEYSFIENSEKIKGALQAVSEMNEGDESLVGRLIKAKNTLDKIDMKSDRLKDLHERLSSLLIEIKELSSEASEIAYDLDSPKMSREELENKLDRYNLVLNKHGLKDQSELVIFMSELQTRVTNEDGILEEISLLEKEVEDLNSELMILAKDLHNTRKNSVDSIELKIKSLLSDLKLPETILHFQLEERGTLNDQGITDLKMYFSANKGVAPVLIEKAASGGELSRVMLALQRLVSEKKQLPTVLFDEIDTGVSGEVAQKIGELLLKMGSNMQLMAISHLPQVAARAQHHLKVEKSSTGESTFTNIRKLSKEESIEEVARLMSGERIDSAAIENAKVLMGL